MANSVARLSPEGADGYRRSYLEVERKVQLSLVVSLSLLSTSQSLPVFSTQVQFDPTVQSSSSSSPHPSYPVKGRYRSSKGLPEIRTRSSVYYCRNQREVSTPTNKRTWRYLRKSFTAMSSGTSMTICCPSSFKSSVITHLPGKVVDFSLVNDLVRNSGQMRW
jgi:hypothetical protein